MPVTQFSDANVTLPNSPDWFGEWEPIQLANNTEEMARVSEEISSGRMSLYTRGELELTQDRVIDQFSPNDASEVMAQITKGTLEDKDGQWPTESDASTIMPGWLVQVASFKELENAEVMSNLLVSKGYRSFIQAESLGGKVFNRVCIGPELRREDAKLHIQKLKQDMGIDALLKPYVPQV